MTTTNTTAAREWWASLTQAERDKLIMQAWPLPKPVYSPVIQDAFRAWVERRVYLDNGGNYRLRSEPATPTYSPRGKTAPWNREVKRMFANSGEFHKAAVKFTNETQANPTGKSTKELTMNTTSKDNLITVELIKGDAGNCISVNHYRVCGPKPVHGTVVETWQVTKNDILRAFLTPDEAHEWLTRELTVVPVEQALNAAVNTEQGPAKEPRQ